jgi:cysteine desulfurase / selenocysteine lyase
MAAPRPVYLDNAATSWPKPPTVATAMVHYLNEIGANPGRSGHSFSIEAGRLVASAREAVAELFHAEDPLRVVFGANVTEALNLALFGLLERGDHVITSSIEHNAMMRPLRHLEREGVTVTTVVCRPDGTLDPLKVQEAIGPRTKLIALTHASNVVGTLLPVAEICAIARHHGLLMLLDSAATAGSVPIHMEASCIDLLAFTGHKSLLGPPGTGGLVIGRRVDVGRMKPLKHGGTGSHSAFEEQPDFLPDKFESGTLNVAGLAGLEAAIRWIMDRGIEAIHARHQDMTRRLIDGLSDISGIKLFGPHDPKAQVDTVSFNLDALSPSDAGFILDEDFQVQCRIGLHCAPAAHRTFGTYPDGTIRFAPGIFTADADIDHALAAVQQLARR